MRPAVAFDLLNARSQVLTSHRETLYAAFKPVEEKQKHMVYQWSLPEGNARHVLDAVAHTCMAERCGKHFGLLGE